MCVLVLVFLNAHYVRCCEPWSDLVAFSGFQVGFEHIAGDWHRLGGCGIGLSSCGEDSMYIN